MAHVVDDPVALFAQLADPSTAPRFFEAVAEDVLWTVTGTHPTAGVYRGKADFVAGTFDVLAPLTRDGLRLTVEHVHVAGDVVIVEFCSSAVTLAGTRLDNRMCWVCRFASGEIVEVREYLDSAMTAYAVGQGRWSR